MKKINFSDKLGLAEAVLSGRQTQARRVIKGDVPLGNWNETYEYAKYKVSEVAAVAQSYKDAGIADSPTPIYDVY